MPYIDTEYADSQEFGIETFVSLWKEQGFLLYDPTSGRPRILWNVPRRERLLLLT